MTAGAAPGSGTPHPLIIALLSDVKPVNIRRIIGRHCVPPAPSAPRLPSLGPFTPVPLALSALCVRHCHASSQSHLVRCRSSGDHFFSRSWSAMLILGRREVIEPHLVRHNLYTVKDPSESLIRPSVMSLCSFASGC